MLSNGLGSVQSNYTGRGLTSDMPLPEGACMAECMCECVWEGLLMRDNENQPKKSKDNESVFAYSFFDLRTSRDKSLSVDPSPSVSEGQSKLKTNDFTCSFDQNSYTLIVRQM